MKTRWLSYGLILVASSVLSLSKMAIYAKLMDPELFGILSTLLGSYAVFVIIASIGVVDGSLKSASMTKDHDTHDSMMGTALSGGILSTSIISSALIVILASTYDTFSSALALAFFLLVLAAFVFNICEIFLRAAGRFQSFAWAIFSKSLLSLVLGTAIISAGYPMGVVATEILAFLCVFFWFQFPRTSVLGFRRPDASRYLELVRAGFAISVSSLSKKLAFMADRWLILLLFGPELLGHYAFLMLFYLIGISAVGVVNTAFGPTLLRKMVDQPHPDVIRATSKLIAVCVLPLTILGCLAVIALFAPIVEHHFPQYFDGLSVLGAALVVVGVGLLAAQALLEWLLIGQDLSHKLIQANMAALLVMVLAYATMSQTEGSVLLFCAIFMATRATSFLLVMWFIFSSSGFTPIKSSSIS